MIQLLSWAACSSAFTASGSGLRLERLKALPSLPHGTGERSQFTFDFYDKNHSGLLEIEEFEQVAAWPSWPADVIRSSACSLLCWLADFWQQLQVKKLRSRIVRWPTGRGSGAEKPHVIKQKSWAF